VRRVWRSETSTDIIARSISIVGCNINCCNKNGLFSSHSLAVVVVCYSHAHRSRGRPPYALQPGDRPALDPVGTSPVAPCRDAAPDRGVRSPDALPASRDSPARGLAQDRHG
jgi:hypothetical protein